MSVSPLRSAVAALLIATTLATTPALANRAGVALKPAATSTSSTATRGLFSRAFWRKPPAAPVKVTRRSAIENELEPKITVGHRAAATLAKLTGGWSFLLSLSAGTLTWTVLHNMLGDPQMTKVNFAISVVTMITTSVGVMVQNLASERERRRGEMDLRINIKAEKEIKELHTKLDTALAKMDQMAAVMAAQAAVPSATPKQD